MNKTGMFLKFNGREYSCEDDLDMSLVQKILDTHTQKPSPEELRRQAAALFSAPPYGKVLQDSSTGKN